MGTCIRAAKRGCISLKQRVFSYCLPHSFLPVSFTYTPEGRLNQRTIDFIVHSWAVRCGVKDESLAWISVALAHTRLLGFGFIRQMQRG